MQKAMVTMVNICCRVCGGRDKGNGGMHQVWQRDALWLPKVCDIFRY